MTTYAYTCTAKQCGGVHSCSAVTESWSDSSEARPRLEERTVWERGGMWTEVTGWEDREAGRDTLDTGSL